MENFLIVLDTELRLLVDPRQLTESETASAISLVALYKALGDGWEVFGNQGDAPKALEQALAPWESGKNKLNT